jgi:hypothetical protein
MSIGPSISPGNSFCAPDGYPDAGKQEVIDIAPTMNNSLLYDFYIDIIEASEALGIDLPQDAVLSKVDKVYARIPDLLVQTKYIQKGFITRPMKTMEPSF